VLIIRLALRDGWTGNGRKHNNCHAITLCLYKNLSLSDGAHARTHTHTEREREVYAVLSLPMICSWWIIRSINV